MSYPDLVAASPAAFHAVAEDVLADDPFTSLNYHFGMLLGVDDFETEQAYHRGKHRLHQGWLHGAGVVWGLALSLDPEHGEVRVEPGLALDGAGRELHLDHAACLDPAAWLEEHTGEVTVAQEPPEGGELAFDAHVVMRFATCLTRSVPALAEPCEGSRAESAYSRMWETVNLELVPGPAPAVNDRYPRVRVLLGLRAPQPGLPAEEQASAARTKVLATAAGDRAAAALAAFREMTNADAAELAPGEPPAPTPQGLSETVVLGDIHRLALKRDGDKLVLAGGEIDYAPRRSHIQTATIQELAAAAHLNAAPPPADAVAVAPDETGGVRVTAVTIDGIGRTARSRKAVPLILTLSGKVDPRSVQPDAFTVSTLTEAGWVDIEPRTPPAYNPDAVPPTITLALASPPAQPWQVIARGTGTRPIVDAAGQRLGNGQDYVYIESSEN